MKGLVGLSHVTQDRSLITIIQLIYGAGRKVEVTYSSKRTGRKRCVERFSISLQIYKNKNKKKKHIFQMKMTAFFFISGKKLYTHDLNFFLILTVFGNLNKVQYITTKPKNSCLGNSC